MRIAELSLQHIRNPFIPLSLCQFIAEQSSQSHSPIRSLRSCKLIPLKCLRNSLSKSLAVPSIQAAWQHCNSQCKNALLHFLLHFKMYSMVLEPASHGKPNMPIIYFSNFPKKTTPAFSSPISWLKFPIAGILPTKYFLYSVILAEV